MKKNNRGFTLIELMATVTLMGILTILTIVSVRKYLDEAKNGAYKDFEKTIKTSASNYLIEHKDKIPRQGEKIVIDVKKLMCDGYLTSLKDPDKPTATCNDDSYVVVERGSNTTFNMDLTYQVCLSCVKYKSEVCSSIETTSLKRYSLCE